MALGVDEHRDPLGRCAETRRGVRRGRRGSLTDGDVLVKGATLVPTLSCSDAHSGVKQCTMRNDNLPLKQGTPVATGVVGAHTFEAFAMDPAGNQTTDTIDYTVAEPAAPQMVTRPTIPEPYVGKQIIPNVGTFSGVPAPSIGAEDIVWYRCVGTNPCAPMPGQGVTFVPTEADVGDRVYVRVTAANASGAISRQSLAKTVKMPPAPTIAAAITGDAVVARPLTAHYELGGDPTAWIIRYWMRCDSAGASCVNITGANNPTYLPTALDRGKRLRLKVTASNATALATAVSEPTAIVGQAPHILSVAIVGDPATVNGLLSTSKSVTALPTATYAYEWRRCTSPGVGCVVAGAKAQYKVMAAGYTYEVTVTATNVWGSDTLSATTEAPGEG